MHETMNESGLTAAVVEVGLSPLSQCVSLSLSHFLSHSLSLLRPWSRWACLRTRPFPSPLSNPDRAVYNPLSNPNLTISYKFPTPTYFLSNCLSDPLSNLYHPLITTLSDPL